MYSKPCDMQKGKKIFLPSHVAFKFFSYKDYSIPDVHDIDIMHIRKLNCGNHDYIYTLNI